MEDELAAFCFDSAIAELGTSIETELEKASQEKKKKNNKVENRRKMVLRRMLAEEEPEKEQKFRDPAEMLKGG